MKSTTTHQLLAAFLALLFVFNCFPITVIALGKESGLLEKGDSAGNYNIGTSAAPNLTCLYEIEERREENAKHFRMSDGTVVAAYYPQAVHRRDANGVWQNIENNAMTVTRENRQQMTVSDTLSADSDTHRFMNLQPTNDASDWLFSIDDGNYHVRFRPDDMCETIGVVSTPQEPENKITPEDWMNLYHLQSSVTYSDIYPNTDLTYIVFGNRIYEQLWLRSPLAQHEYTFRMELSGLLPELQTDGSICMYDSDTGTPVYVIPPSYMIDASGAYSDSVAYELISVSGNEFLLNLIPDREWLTDENRVYPVMIDPPVDTVSATSPVTTYISSSSPSSTHGNAQLIYAGRNDTTVYEAYWKYDGIFANYTDPNYEVLEASLTLLATGAGIAETKIGAFLVSSGWDTGLTWNMVHVSDSVGAPGRTSDAPLSCVTLEANSSYKAYEMHFDITKAAQMWKSGEAYNFGLCFKSVGSDNTTGNHTVYLDTFAWTDYRWAPSVKVTYRDLLGIEENYSYTHMNLDDAGDAWVRNQSGALILTTEALATSENLFGYTMSLTYYDGASDRPHPATAGAAPLGPNWRADWQQYVYQAGNSYIWIDSDGTAHYFGYLSDNTYQCEDNPQIFLTVYYDDEDPTVTKGYAVYKNTENSTAHLFNAAGYLIAYQDLAGNQLRFIWGMINGHYYVTRIRLHLRSDGTAGSSTDNDIDELTLTYTTVNGTVYLSKVNNAVTKEHTVFAYTSGSSTQSVKYLIAISQYRNQEEELYNISEYYQSSGRIYRVVSIIRDGFACAATVIYNENDRVSTLKKDHYSDGQWVFTDSYEFIYQNQHTIVQSRGGDDVYGTSDDLLTHYIFDARCREVAAYTTDLTQQKIYSVSSAGYLADTSQITSVMDHKGVPRNLLTNGSFEKVGGWILSDTDRIGYVNASAENAVPVNRIYNGHASLRMFLTGQTGTLSATQHILLSPGTYTFTAYVRVSDELNTSLSLSVSGTADPDFSAVSLPLKGAMTELAKYEFYPMQVSFSITEQGLYTLALMADLTTASDAYVWFDDAMLTTGSGLSNFNLLNNAGFEEGETAAYWTPARAQTGMTDAEDSLFGTRCLSLNGSVYSAQYAAQSVFDHAGASASAETYVIAGWGKSSDAMRNAGSVKFGLQATVSYTDGEEAETHFFPFNPYCWEWQYVSGTFTTAGNRIVDTITVYCVYSYNGGTALFDDISLVRDLSGIVTSFEYDSNKKLLASYKNTDGILITYNQNNMINTIAKDGQVYFVSYDEEADTRVGTVSTIVDTNTDGSGKKQITNEYTYNEYGQIIESTIRIAGEENSPAIRTSTTYLTDYSENNGACFGYVTSETDASGRTTRYVYQDGKLQKVLFPGNSGSVNGLYYQYNSNGTLFRILPIVSGTQQDTGGIRYSYSRQGKALITGIITPTVTYKMTYNAFGQMTLFACDDNAMAIYSYAPNGGKLKEVSYANGYTERYVYDDLGRLQEVICIVKNFRLIYQGGETPTPGTSINIDYPGVYEPETTLYRIIYNDEGKVTEKVDCIMSTRTFYEYNVSGAMLREMTMDASASSMQLISSVFAVSDPQASTSSKVYLLATGDGSMKRYRYTTTYSSIGNTPLSQDVESGSSSLHTEFCYDAFQRMTEQETTVPGGGLSYRTQYGYASYLSGGQSYTSYLVDSYHTTLSGANGILDDRNWHLTYDSRGNIATVSCTQNDASVVISYFYDAYNRLARENNFLLNRTYVYAYDDAGNITRKTTYPYSVNSLPSQALETSQYFYASRWKDRLNRIVTTNSAGTETKYIKYDPVGNPYVYDSYSLSWKGRQLTGLTGADGLQVTYRYNADGLRAEKTVGTTTYSYLWADDQLLRVTATVGTDANASVSYADFLYDAGGTVMAMRYVSGGTETLYRFVTTYAGDVVAIRSESGDLLAEFTYDAWGNFTYETTPTPGSALDLSCFRYRGYLYDNETDWYYLRSRYYAPDEGRFISTDSYMATGETAVSHNMYAYANDNPVMYVDENGELSLLLFVAIVAAVVIVGEILSYASNDMMKESNLEKNRRYEDEREAAGESNDAYILDQGIADGRADSYRYGAFSGKFNACEAIAIFNALKYFDNKNPTDPSYTDVRFSDVLYNIQENHLMILWGFLGTRVRKLGVILSEYHINYSTFNSDHIDEFDIPGTYIASFFWTDTVIIHTVFIECINDTTSPTSRRYYIYNMNGDDTILDRTALPPTICNHLIIGYRIWKE